MDSEQLKQFLENLSMMESGMMRTVIRKLAYPENPYNPEFINILTSDTDKVILKVNNLLKTSAKVERKKAIEETDRNDFDETDMCPFIDPPLIASDPQVYDIIEHEKSRQWEGLELIASENFVSTAVLEALGSPMTNKYAEGIPGHRYYGGTEWIDEIELLTQSRALELFGLDPEKWGVNVQPLSGSPANFAVYNALLEPGGKLMGLNLPDGGHLTHGFQTGEGRPISASAKYFQSHPYFLDKETGIIDYDRLEEDAEDYEPKIIVCGASAYPREWDYKRLREIADKVGAYLMCDMAHTAGLIAAKLLDSPFEMCDIVTSTTHKTLRGPRSGLIFYTKNPKFDFEKKINFSVFPSLQGGPHENTITAVAVALNEAMSPCFIKYQKHVLLNSKTLSSELQRLGYKIVSGGTDNHIVLVDLNDKNIDGARVEKVLELVNITVNKNTVPNDLKPLVPHGLRLGSPALTTRGLSIIDFKKVAYFVHKGIKLAIRLKKENPGLRLRGYIKKVIELSETDEKLISLKNNVQNFARTFPFPGFNEEKLRYR